MNSGDAFIPIDDSIQYPHIYIVISDTERDSNRVLIVSVTTMRIGRDSSCLIEVGDHPFIQHQSSINYGEARIVQNDDLDWNTKLGKIEQLEPVDEAVLEKIRHGAEVSPYISEGCRRFLIRQGLISDK